MTDVVRVLQMSNKDPEFLGKAGIQVQEYFFLGELPNREGIYQYRTKGLEADEGTIVLFQYESHIIASAVYVDRTVYPSPQTNQGVSYRGEFHFRPGSIKVFDPISPAAMKEIWPEFDPDVRRTWELNGNKYQAFVQSLKNVHPEACLSPDEGYESDDEDERPTVNQQVKLRRGAKKFRNKLLNRFDGACLVTGCKIRDLLEAAHIHPHRGVKDDHSENGLLLRADIHTMFDLYLLAIEPETLTVQLHPKLSNDPYYQQFHGKPLGCADKHPSKVELIARFQEFKRRMA